MGSPLKEASGRALALLEQMTPMLLAMELDRATSALTSAGFTLVEGAQEWKPPIGPSASPLLDRIYLMAELLQETIHSVRYEEMEANFSREKHLQTLRYRINAALAGKLPERRDTEWTDAASTPTADDYRELQAQHDQVQSRLKAALDALREAKTYARWESEQYTEADLEVPVGLAKLLATIDALLAGQVLEPAVPDALVAISDIASLQRYTLGGHCDSFGQDCGAEMEQDDEGEYVLLAEALMLAAPKLQGGE